MWSKKTWKLKIKTKIEMENKKLKQVSICATKRPLTLLLFYEKWNSYLSLTISFLYVIHVSCVTLTSMRCTIYILWPCWFKLFSFLLFSSHILMNLMSIKNNTFEWFFLSHIPWPKETRINKTLEGPLPYYLKVCIIIIKTRKWRRYNILLLPCLI